MDSKYYDDPIFLSSDDSMVLTSKYDIWNWHDVTKFNPNIARLPLSSVYISNVRYDRMH